MAPKGNAGYGVEHRCRGDRRSPGAGAQTNIQAIIGAENQGSRPSVPAPQILAPRGRPPVAPTGVSPAINAVTVWPQLRMLTIPARPVLCPVQRVGRTQGYPKWNVSCAGWLRGSAGSLDPGRHLWEEG